ncbi:hypothetical protein [Nonomuraea jiangxiensis]|uniref:Uncharacterized protein n=1 Tax=Nonomuraea jiangxiensis TaxID=633440 RepID=A0A1G9I5J6_9ACTN|nr:hypothetical protein [Nonomuraea jiangxiensis]SDL20517.1 hypothetical protein SAMN05421869_12389 [Nonomuraea jiangxiensis]
MHPQIIDYQMRGLGFYVADHSYDSSKPSSSGHNERWMFWGPILGGNYQGHDHRRYRLGRGDLGTEGELVRRLEQPGRLPHHNLRNRSDLAGVPGQRGGGAVAGRPAPHVSRW